MLRFGTASRRFLHDIFVEGLARRAGAKTRSRRAVFRNH